MADLRIVKPEVAYRSELAAPILRDFYLPCFQQSILYRRAVGYFTSGSLYVAAQGVAHFIRNGGRIRLVASPALCEEDLEAISSGYRRRETVVRDAVARTFGEVVDQLVHDRLAALAWLIGDGRLEVHLAIPVDASGAIRRGIYHEKIGVFTDVENRSIAFSGSSNETASGLVENFESIDVFWSWDDPQQRVSRKINDFERLWSNSTKGLEVIEFTSVAREILARFKTDLPPERDPLEGIESIAADRNNGRLSIPWEIKLRDYQQEAINNWLRNRGRGTFKMATGSGKTITALSAAARLAEHGRLDALVIVCPYRHLVTQWAREVRRFGGDPVLAFESRAKWIDDLAQRLFAVNSGASPFVCVITTTTTFSTESFQSRLQYLPRRSLLIADEVHNMGASQLRQSLPDQIPLRLALSATPERWFDESGTQAIFEFFGPVLEPQFTLADAIRQGALVPYRYWPILVELTEDEMIEYVELSERIAKASAIADEGADNQALTTLLAKRSRLLAVAANKLAALRIAMEQRLSSDHTLFYCGDGTVENDASDGVMLRHVDEVAKLLGNDLGFRVATYTAETSLVEREDLRVRIDSGDLQGLVAIRCLDEGVDIPSVRTAFILASSKNPRQFIQRRGRVLRPAPGKQSADIFDMIVMPPDGCADFKTERKLLRGELTRFAEFADLALNAGEARGAILEMQRKYHLLDV